MPFKNTALFLEECLTSIQRQSHENWELIAVDDGSTDHSFSIVKKYADIDDRIHVFKNNGIGIIKALQLAYSKSTGKYVTRMDSDDIMPYFKLTSMRNQLRKHGRGHIALGLVKYFSNFGISDGYYKYERWLNKLTQQGNNFKEIYKECVIPSPCWMVHKLDFDLCGAFNSNVYPEDYDLAFRFYEHGLTCLKTDKVLHYWRDYSERTSRTHEHYSDNRFLDLKMHYFIKLHLDTTKTQVLWGAGTKGKFMARKLQKAGANFIWICNNPKKWNKKIYGHELKKVESIDGLFNVQHLISIAEPTAQTDIQKIMDIKQLESLKDYFFFC